MGVNIFIKKALNMIGFNLKRVRNTPELTFLGLKQLPVKTIIDVGANEGQFAKKVQKFYPGAEILCFEPLHEPFKKLQNWASGRDRVQVFNLALGDAEGEVNMHCHLEHSPSSSLLTSTGTKEVLYPFTKKQALVTVKLSTLDKVLENLSKTVCADIMVKLDVQGYEDRVIKGGMETLRKARICILEVNLDKLYDNQANFNELSTMLYELGFRYAGNLEQTYANDGHAVFIDAVFTK